MGVRAMPSRLRDIAVASLSGVGIVGASEVRVLANGSTTTPYQYWKDWAGPEYWHTDLETALGLCEGGRNEVILVTPESHAQADPITHSKNMVHVVGMYGPAMQNHRSRIGHSVTVSPLLTVSGEGSTFANLYFPYGLANATDLNLLTVTGARNSFRNCHFLQTNATPLDEAGFKLIDLQSSETYFKDCFIGGDTVAWTNGCMVNFAASAAPPRVVFDNCVFLMNADNSQVRFLKAVAGLGRCAIIFKGCQFINMGTALAYAIDGAGLINAMMYFDNNCYFAGCTEVVEVAYEAYVHLAPANTPINQVTGGNSVALFNGLSAHPDVS